MAVYRFEDLTDTTFQEMVQAVLLHLHPDLSLPPVRQPDGGHDAFQLQDDTGVKIFSAQVKWVKDQRQERDPVKWLEDVVKKEERNLRRMASQGTREWLLVTNVQGSSHPEVGMMDRLNTVLTRESRRLKIKMRAWWRNELSRAVDNAPSETKFAYLDMLTGADIVRAVMTTTFASEKKNKLTRVIKAAAHTQWDQDGEVRFKHGELNGVPIAKLFVDMPVSAAVGSTDSGLSGLRLLLGQRLEKPSVLLGAPGQGKSTLAQFVCQVYRAHFVQQASPLEPKNPDSHSNDPRVPYRVDLRDYARWVSGHDPFAAEGTPSGRGRSPLTSIESFLAHLLSHASGITIDADDVQFALDWLPSFVALDGLDEVAEVRVRAKVVSEIEEFASRCASYSASARLLVTARPSYTDVPEPHRDRFSYYELLPLTRDLREEYLGKWSRSQNLEERDIIELRRVFQSRTAENHVLELATNPMQLAILLYLMYRRGDSIPTNRTELYSSYMELFLDRESLMDEVVKNNRKLLERVTGYIAWHLHSEAESEGGTGRATRKQLIRLVRHYLLDLEEDPDIADSLFTAVTARVWVITSRTEGYFEFDVQPIREYFAARHLFVTAPDSSRDEGVDRFRRLLALMQRPYWLNVTRFMAGMFDDGVISTLADRVEDLIEGTVPQFWSRQVAGLLLTDGVFDAAARPRRRIIHRAFDDIGVVAALSQQRPSSAPIPLVHGGQATVDFLRSELTTNLHTPLSTLRAKLLSRYAVPAKPALTWWLQHLDTLTDTKDRRRWIELSWPLHISQSIPSDVASALADEDPSWIPLLVDIGIKPSIESDLATDMVQVVIRGEETAAHGKSFAADLALLTRPLFLRNRGARTDEDPDDVNADTRSIEQDRAYAAAIQRLRKYSDFGATFANALKIKPDRRYNTFRANEIANAVEVEYGRNWLSARIVIAAAADLTLELGVAARSRTTEPFGPSQAAAGILREFRNHSRDSQWWLEQRSHLEDELDRLVWLLGAATCAQNAILRDLMSAIIETLAECSAETAGRLVRAVDAVAMLDGVRRVERSIVFESLSESVPVAALLLPLVDAESSTAFSLEQLTRLFDDPALASSFAQRYWIDLAARNTLSLEDLMVLERFGPVARFPEFDGTFDPDLAEIILSEPSRYPATLLHAADKRVNEKTHLQPLAAVAEKEEWFSLPD